MQLVDRHSKYLDYYRGKRQRGEIYGVTDKQAPVPQLNDLQIVLPQPYCITTEGDRFLQEGGYANNSRMLLFGLQKDLKFLARCPHWYMDGTFDTLPQQFMQLYTVHGIKDGRNVIGAYAMLTNKLEVTSERVLRHDWKCKSCNN